MKLPNALFKLMAYFFSVYRLYAKLTKSQWVSREELEAMQQDRLSQLLGHARQFVPYYREKLHKLPTGFGVRDGLANIPILTRTDLQHNYQGLCDERTSFREKVCITTSGTTGMAAKVYLDKPSSLYSRALQKRSDYEWTRTPFLSRKVSVTTRAKPPSRVQSLFRMMRRHWKLSVVNPETNCFICDTELAPGVQQVEHLKPDIITGNATSVRRLAEYALDHDIKLRPNAVVSIAEMLTPATKSILEKAFHCRVYNQYGMSEFGVIGAECQHGNLHINAERFIVAVVRDGAQAAPGEEGQLLVTDLINFGFPLIRYATGDIGALSSDECPCGRKLPVLDKLLGRTVDYIATPSGKQVLATNVDHIAEEFTRDQIVQLQLFQPSIEQLVVKIIKGSKYSEEIGERILLTLELNFKQSGIHIHLEFVASIPNAKSGKYQFYCRGY